MMHRPPQLQRGFTLLETILAVSLSAVLMGLIAAGLQIYTQIVADRNADVTNAQLARGVLQQISSDLRATIFEEPEEEDIPLSAEGDEGGAFSTTAADTGSAGDGTTSTDSTTSADTEMGDSTTSESSVDLANTTVSTVRGLFGNQTELRIDVRGSFPHPLRYDSLVAAGGDPLMENLLSVDRVITFYLRPSSPSELVGTPLETPGTVDQSQQMMILVRRIQKRAEAEFDAVIGGSSIQTGEQLLSDQVVGLEFAYHDGYDWTDSWDSELQGGLPIAVQVTLTIADPTDENSVITMDNVFQVTVALPTAVIPEDTTASEGF